MGLILNEIGELLRTTREDSGVSIDEASNDLEIKTLVLENIEDGNIGCFKDIFVLKESEYHLGNDRPLERTTLGPSSTIFVGFVVFKDGTLIHINRCVTILSIDTDEQTATVFTTTGSRTASHAPSARRRRRRRCGGRSGVWAGRTGDSARRGAKCGS